MTVARSPGEHAQTVREAIRGEYDDVDRKALVALAALVAVAEEKPRGDLYAAYEQAEADRDRLRERVAELEAALREVLGYAENNDEQRINDRFDAIHRIARAALEAGSTTPLEGRTGKGAA